MPRAGGYASAAKAAGPRATKVASKAVLSTRSPITKAVRQANTARKEHVPNVPKRPANPKVLPERTGNNPRRRGERSVKSR